MKTVGIIAEYNPFHNGHAYHIAMAKELTGADFAVVVMSPDFVQRGEPAILNKYSRAKTALENGADLVLELPLYFACGSAEYFAKGAVALLDALGCIDALCFGCETEHGELLIALADSSLEESDRFRLALRKNLRAGKTYPQSYTDAMADCLSGLSFPGFPADNTEFLCPEDISAVLSSPNNILGLEYCKALRRQNSSILPYPLQRKGKSYLDSSIGGSCCSAVAIRKRVFSDVSGGGIPASSEKNFPGEDLAVCMPESSLQALRSAQQSGTLTSLSDFSSLIHYRLLSEEHPERFLDVSEDLAERIANTLPYYKDISQYLSLLKTKQWTQARIRRALLHILLHITKEEVSLCTEDNTARYARILGFQNAARPLLHVMKKNAAIPILTKPADAKKILSGTSYPMLARDIYASHMYQLAACSRRKLPIRSEFTRSPIIL